MPNLNSIAMEGVRFTNWGMSRRVRITVTAATWQRRIGMPQGSWRVLTYSVGGVAAFWTIERVAQIVP